MLKVKKKFYKKYLLKKQFSKLYILFVNKLINRFLKQGKKEKSIKLFYKVKYLLKDKTFKEPLFIIFLSIIKGCFKFYFIKKRLGRIFKDLPMHLSKARQVRYYVKRLYRYSKAKKIRRGFSLSNLTNLIIRTFRRKGFLIKVNNKNYRKVMENRVFLFILNKRK